MHAARAPPQEIGGAVALLHAQGLCHADIKPENLLLTGEESKAGGQGVKLVDFGLSCEFVAADGGELERTDPNRGTKSVGTKSYWPPELYDQPHAPASGPGLPMDLWALGVVLYILLVGFHPFDDGHIDAATLRQRILTDAPDWAGCNASAQV